MKRLPEKISMGVIIMILGIMLAIQIKSIMKINQTKNQQTKRVDELAFELSRVQNEKEDILSQLRNREKIINQYEQAASKESETSKILKQDKDKYAKMAGMVDIKGKGVIITIDDSKNNNPNADPTDLITHDVSLLYVVNDLRASGAESISINGERLVSTSEIKCAGTLIMVNSVKVGPPFVIKAIGEPDLLYGGIKIRNGVYDYLTSLGLQMTVEKKEDIFIPRYKGNYEFKYSKDVLEGSGAN